MRTCARVRAAVSRNKPQIYGPLVLAPPPPPPLIAAYCGVLHSPRRPTGPASALAGSAAAYCGLLLLIAAYCTARDALPARRPLVLASSPPPPLIAAYCGLLRLLHIQARRPLVLASPPPLIAAYCGLLRLIVAYCGYCG